MPTQTFTTDGTWVAPADVDTARCEAFGGGGGGAGGSSTQGGGGGGGGGYARLDFSPTPGNSYTIVVGTGGAGGAANNSGSDGNDTTVNGSGISEIRGDGGSGGTIITGGAGGGGQGAVVIIGGDGGDGDGDAYADSGGGGGGACAEIDDPDKHGDDASSDNGGRGGTKTGDGGDGGDGGDDAVAGSDGSPYGGGGGGGGEQAAGGDGAQGRVVIGWTTIEGSPASPVKDVRRRRRPQRRAPRAEPPRPVFKPQIVPVPGGGPGTQRPSGYRSPAIYRRDVQRPARRTVVLRTETTQADVNAPIVPVLEALNRRRKLQAQRRIPPRPKQRRRPVYLFSTTGDTYPPAHKPPQYRSRTYLIQPPRPRARRRPVPPPVSTKAQRLDVAVIFPRRRLHVSNRTPRVVLSRPPFAPFVVPAPDQTEMLLDLWRRRAALARIRPPRRRYVRQAYVNRKRPSTPPPVVDPRRRPRPRSAPRISARRRIDFSPVYRGTGRRLTPKQNPRRRPRELEQRSQRARQASVRLSQRPSRGQMRLITRRRPSTWLRDDPRQPQRRPRLVSRVGPDLPGIARAPARIRRPFRRLDARMRRRPAVPILVSDREAVRILTAIGEKLRRRLARRERRPDFRPPAPFWSVPPVSASSKAWAPPRKQVERDRPSRRSQRRPEFRVPDGRRPGVPDSTPFLLDASARRRRAIARGWRYPHRPRRSVSFNYTPTEQPINTEFGPATRIAIRPTATHLMRATSTRIEIRSTQTGGD